MLQVRAEKPDGTPAVGTPVEMCKGDMCFNLTVPEDGMIVTAAGENEFNIRVSGQDRVVASLSLPRLEEINGGLIS